jgi:hypothetical protein
MLRNRLYYWSSGRVAEYILGEKKPLALEWGAWDEYYADLQKRKPIRYWISQKFLKHLQNILYYPYDMYHSIKVYIKNRWIDKIQYLDTGLKPGYYYEFDDRILHGLFNELINFVEIELAHLSLWGTDKKYKFKNGRCIEAAYDYFNWASKLKDRNENGKRIVSKQAKDARRIKKLYEWWKNIRPNRIDHSVKSGWAKEYEEIEKNGYKSKKTSYKTILKKQHIEDQYDAEDEAMLIELIKLRKSLWT